MSQMRLGTGDWRRCTNICHWKKNGCGFVLSASATKAFFWKEGFAMAEPVCFKSILAPFISGLLEEKHSLGFDYHTEELLLARFDRYCSESDLDTINVTKEFLDKWCTRMLRGFLPFLPTARIRQIKISFSYILAIRTCCFLQHVFYTVPKGIRYKNHVTY